MTLNKFRTESGRCGDVYDKRLSGIEVDPKHVDCLGTVKINNKSRSSGDGSLRVLTKNCRDKSEHDRKTTHETERKCSEETE